MKVRDRTAGLWAFRIVTGLLTIAAVIVYLTVPRPQNTAASNLQVEFLPPSEWGFGYFCADSPTSPESGYAYGFVRVTRRYHFRSQ